MARPKVYKGADGWWHCYVTVGTKPDGKLDRRHLRGRTRTAVIEKLDRLEGSVKAGHTPKVGQSETVAEWLDHWLTTIAARKCRASTLEGYESKIRTRLKPGLGHHRLAKLRVEAVEAYFAEMEREVAPATALQCFRILSRALKVARQRGKIPLNPCDLMDAPSAEQAEIEPLDTAEVAAVLRAAADTRLAARWWIALMLGLRQGEALGLRWEYVDLDSGVLHVRRALARRRWKHGCPEPCGKLPRSCPNRHGGGLVFEEPKSRKSKRDLPLYGPLLEMLREHRTEQLRERLKAGPTWDEWGLVFCQPNGRPINPRSDWGDWKQLLAGAGVRDARLHDARHTFATWVLGEGIRERVAQDLLGHSQASMTARYQHALPEHIQAAAKKLGSSVKRLQPRGATMPRRTGTDDLR